MKPKADLNPSILNGFFSVQGADWNIRSSYPLLSDIDAIFDDRRCLSSKGTVQPSPDTKLMTDVAMSYLSMTSIGLHLCAMEQIDSVSLIPGIIEEGDL